MRSRRSSCRTQAHRDGELPWAGKKGREFQAGNTKSKGSEAGKAKVFVSEESRQEKTVSGKTRWHLQPWPVWLSG